MKVSIHITVNAPSSKVWAAWTSPEDIVNWNFASDTWQCPKAENDLRTGGTFSYRMEAKDGSSSFDFSGKYTDIDQEKRIAYTLGGNREVEVTFEEQAGSTTIQQTFEAEDENSAQQQKQGWLSILTQFKKYVETNHLEKDPS